MDQAGNIQVSKVAKFTLLQDVLPAAAFSRSAMLCGRPDRVNTYNKIYILVKQCYLGENLLVLVCNATANVYTLCSIAASSGARQLWDEAQSWL